MTQPKNRSVKTHWLETAERTSDTAPLLGEDEHGDLYVPSRRRAGWWDRPLNLCNPSHWRYYLNSRRLDRVVFLETR